MGGEGGLFSFFLSWSPGAAQQALLTSRGLCLYAAGFYFSMRRPSLRFNENEAFASRSGSQTI